MFNNYNNFPNIMKLLVPIISIKMLKLIPMVLLASILAISFSLFTSPNAFATQVYESSIAKFEYPDNWNIFLNIGNGEGIYLQPINEPNVYMIKLVLQDSANSFSNMVEAIKQAMMNTGFQIDELQNVPGLYVFSKTGFNNGIDWNGLVAIEQVPNSNDVVISEYTAESSKFQQYGSDGSGFFVSTYLSPQEQGVQEQEVPLSSGSEDFFGQFMQGMQTLLNDPAIQGHIENCMRNPGSCPSSDDQQSLTLQFHPFEGRDPTFEFRTPP